MPHKPLLQRLGDKAADKLVEVVVGGILAVLLAWAALSWRWFQNEWACIKKPWCEVEGWSLGLLIAFAIALTAATLYLGLRFYRTSRSLREAQAPAAAPKSGETRMSTAAEAAFHKITVIDERLKLRWFIIRPPREWLPWRDIQNNLGQSAVQQVLDGPFHAVPGCNAPLGERWVGTLDERHLVFVDTCPSCGKRIFRARSDNVVVAHLPRAFSVRAQALEELQRLERNGTALDATVPVVLEKPGYWKAMLPP